MDVFDDFEKRGRALGERLRRFAAWLREERPAGNGVALAALALAAAAGFLLGRQMPESEFRAVARARDAAAAALAQSGGESLRLSRRLEEARAQAGLSRATAAQLESQLRALDSERANLVDELAFYRRVFGERGLGGEVTIRGLELTPEFEPNRYRLNAALIRGDNARKDFGGDYGFAVALAGGETLRLPAAGATLSFRLYQDLTEFFELPEGARVESVRLQVRDQKSRVVAEDTLVFDAAETESETPESQNGEAAPAAE